MLETIFAFLGTIVGYGTCAILNVLKDKPKQIDVKQELIYLTDQVIGCKNRLENIENKVYIEHKKIRNTLDEIQLNNAVDSNVLYRTRKEVKELTETTCRQTNNLKNCIVNKKRRR